LPNWWIGCNCDLAMAVGASLRRACCYGFATRASPKSLAQHTKDIVSRMEATGQLGAVIQRYSDPASRLVPPGDVWQAMTAVQRFDFLTARARSGGRGWGDKRWRILTQAATPVEKERNLDTGEQWLRAHLREQRADRLPAGLLVWLLTNARYTYVQRCVQVAKALAPSIGEQKSAMSCYMFAVIDLGCDPNHGPWVQSQFGTSDQWIQLVTSVCANSCAVHDCR
jgi:hypothetical protein